MSFGNRIGFQADEEAAAEFVIRGTYPLGEKCTIFEREFPGWIVAELAEDVPYGKKIGMTIAEAVISLPSAKNVPIDELLALNEGVLEDVYPTRTALDGTKQDVPTLTASSAPLAAPKIGIAKPKVLIPVFPGSNCEYDSARAVLRGGLDAEIFVINNQSARDVAESARRFAAAADKSQIIFIPGGFSGGDEPEGSGKFITAFFRNPQVADAARELLKNRDGLMLGICNGFQALIKLGLVPYGDILDTDENCPTLTYNVIGRHQSKIVRTRIASTRSPWLSKVSVGDVISVPISHGEGRFVCRPDLLRELADKGQIATQYVDLSGAPSMATDFNPNGSDWAAEGILSPDGRIFGKMGHAERTGPYLYKNVPGNYNLRLFEAAKDYFNV